MNKFQEAGLRIKRAKVMGLFPNQGHVGKGAVPEGTVAGDKWHYGYFDVTAETDRTAEGTAALRLELNPSNLELEKPALVAGTTVAHFVDGTFAERGAKL